MLLGAAGLLLLGTRFLTPVWRLVRFDPQSHLLSILIFARICGWSAEFLFNQTLLPLST